jgi:uncharacterized protein YggE
MQKLIVLGLLFAFVFTFADADTPYITTTGEASIFVQPDQAIITLGVDVYNKELSEAKNENDAKSSKLVAAIKNLGIDDCNIQTQTMNLDIVYKNNYGAVGEVEISGTHRKSSK